MRTVKDSKGRTIEFYPEKTELHRFAVMGYMHWFLDRALQYEYRCSHTDNYEDCEDCDMFWSMCSVGVETFLCTDPRIGSLEGYDFVIMELPMSAQDFEEIITALSHDCAGLYDEAKAITPEPEEERGRRGKRARRVTPYYIKEGELGRDYINAVKIF